MTAIQRLCTLALCALAALAGSAACESHGKPQPSLNTVDPTTHAPYQRRQPKTTGNPMSDTDAYPDRPGDDDHAEHQEVPPKPAVDEAPARAPSAER